MELSEVTFKKVEGGLNILGVWEEKPITIAVYKYVPDGIRWEVFTPTGTTYMSSEGLPLVSPKTSMDISFTYIRNIYSAAMGL